MIYAIRYTKYESILRFKWVLCLWSVVSGLLVCDKQRDTFNHFKPFYAKQTQFPGYPNERKFCYDNALYKFTTSQKRKKQTQFKPNSNPIQTQFKANSKPIQTQFKPNSNPIQTQSKPNIGSFRQYKYACNVISALYKLRPETRRKKETGKINPCRKSAS